MENIRALVEQCGLGTIDGEISPVSGGLMHKKYKVQTTTGTYAVKCLNPEIMGRPDALKNYSEAERLESILEDNGIPIVAALSFDDLSIRSCDEKKMISINGKYYYVFPWQEGSITDFDAITGEQCYKAGEIQGRIHAIDANNISPEEPSLSEVDFDALLECAKDKGRAKVEESVQGKENVKTKDRAIAKDSTITPILEANLQILKNAQDKLNEARKNLPAMRAISNDDMDPKNIMWHEGNPHVIDLECLGYSNPISSCLDLALQWAGTVNGKFNKDNLKAFFKGYLGAYDNGFRSYDELFGIAYTWIEWLEYNIKRALGMVSDDADEIKLGETETENTIKRIKYLSSIEDDICLVLKNLPAPDASKYKTHDDRLCYIDLVFEGGLDNIPHYELPEGYHFVPYKSGDKKAWIDIELSAEEVLDKEHGEECWQRYYGNAESELPVRMYFVEDDFGEKVATATAFYDIHGNSKAGEGQLHWVAIKKDSQGKGLSKPLITFVLNVMKKLGYSTVRIHTQTNTWLACRVYYDLGFRPDAESLIKNKYGWKMVELLTDRHYFS